MKSKLLIFCILIFSQELAAQSTVVQPEVFRLSKNLDTACPQWEAGKVYYHTPTNTVKYCGDDLLEKSITTYWEGNADIYYMGKVGISKNSPLDELDVLSRARFNTLLVEGRIGINTSTPTEKLEIVNRRIDIISSTDEVTWTLFNFDAADRFEFRGQGVTKMLIKYGGNICIGATTNTEKLRVEGDVSYAENLTIEGKGILTNSNANQLQMYTFASSTSNRDFYIGSNTCSTISFSFPSNQFTVAPAVFLGQSLAPTQSGLNLIKSIVNVTAAGGQIQFCNLTAGEISFGNQSFSLIAIGQ
ncbi:hypothetical protein [Emticicia sp. BO119]|uniref:hypothetical protein n=1 Tax=Emticicia sp. BO119 TaxID=2757768 RepID=UPI0015F12038|nr:hypothetical protein [Emticicia sp. BO119]MBA4853964.1 hypothetical protein [Emticicia sp. BO119]